MRQGLSAIAAKGNITAQWVFEVDSNYWTFGNPIVYALNTYSSRVISDSFTGIKEKNTRYADRMIAPNTTEFSITGDKTDFNPSDFKGKDVLISLLDAGVLVFAWRFSVKSCDFGYGKFNFKCEDFLQKYLFQNYYPNTDLLNGFNDTTAIFEGPDNAVIPQVFGTAYAPLRMVPDSNEWFYVLGAISGTYTIDEISSPTDFDKNSTYAPPTYSFTQSVLSGLQVFANDIGASGGNAPFGKSGKLYDLPTKFSNSLTASITNAADLISYILQVLGVPLAQIDVAGTFATTKAALTTLGITYNYCFTTKEDALKVLCELLESCNCIMPRSDVIQLILLEDDTAVKTIDRENILDLKFSEKTYAEDFDGGYATYYTGVQDGEPSEIPIAINGTSYTNISAEKVLYKYTSDTEIIQKLSIIYYRRKFLQTGTISFSSNHSMLEPYLGDRLTITDDLYEEYENVYVDQITIKADLKFEFSLDAYSEAIGDLTDYSPSAVSKITDLSPFVAPFLLENMHVGENEAGTHLENSAILSGQTGYDTGYGWWLGRDGGNAKFSLKNATSYLRFDENGLEVSGLTIIGARPTTHTNDWDDEPVGVDKDLWIPGGEKTIVDGTYTISNVSTLEHDILFGRYNSQILIDETHSIVAYNGSSNLGCIKTIYIDPVTFVPSEIDLLVHNNVPGFLGAGRYNSLVMIDSTHFILACSDGGNIGHTKTFSIDASYQISLIDDFVVQQSGLDMSMFNSSFVMIDSTHFVLACSYSDGFIIPFSVDASYAVTQGTILTHTSGQSINNQLLLIDSTHMALSYSLSTIGYIKIFEIDGSYANSELSVFTIGGVSNNWLCMSMVIYNSNHLALAYTDSSDDGTIKIFKVSASYVITDVSSMVFDTVNSTEYISMVLTDGTHLAVAYAGAITGVTKTGVIKTIEVDEEYAVTEVGTLTFDVEQGLYNSLAKIDSSHLVNAYAGLDDDGYITVLGVDADIDNTLVYPIIAEIYIWTGGEWVIATKYDETTVTTIAAAMIDTPLVITNSIRDRDSTLEIDFTSATITVNKATDGLILNGGMTVNDGGDIKLMSSVADVGEIEFYSGVSLIGSITRRGSKGSFQGSYLNWIPGTDQSYTLSLGDTGQRWHNIKLHSSGDLNLYSDTYSKLSASNSGVRVEPTSVILTVGGAHSIKMVDGIEIHTGLQVMTTAVALASSAAIALAIGDWFNYSNSDDFNVPSMIYRDSLSTLISARIP